MQPPSLARMGTGRSIRSGPLSPSLDVTTKRPAPRSVPNPTLDALVERALKLTQAERRTLIETLLFVEAVSAAVREESHDR